MKIKTLVSILALPLLALLVTSAFAQTVVVVPEQAPPPQVIVVPQQPLPPQAPVVYVQPAPQPVIITPPPVEMVNVNFGYEVRYGGRLSKALDYTLGDVSLYIDGTFAGMAPTQLSLPLGAKVHIRLVREYCRPWEGYIFVRRDMCVAPKLVYGR